MWPFRDWAVRKTVKELEDRLLTATRQLNELQRDHDALADYTSRAVGRWQKRAHRDEEASKSPQEAREPGPRADLPPHLSIAYQQAKKAGLLP